MSPPQLQVRVGSHENDAAFLSVCAWGRRLLNSDFNRAKPRSVTGMKAGECEAATDASD